MSIIKHMIQKYPSLRHRKILTQSSSASIKNHAGRNNTSLKWFYDPDQINHSDQISDMSIVKHMIQKYSQSIKNHAGRNNNHQFDEINDYDQINDEINDSDQINDEINDSDPINDQINDSINDQINNQINNQINDQIKNQINKPIK